MGHRTPQPGKPNFAEVIVGALQELLRGRSGQLSCASSTWARQREGRQGCNVSQTMSPVALESNCASLPILSDQARHLARDSPVILVT
jgi:hypothetical protein